MLKKLKLYLLIIGLLLINSAKLHGQDVVFNNSNSTVNSTNSSQDVSFEDDKKRKISPLPEGDTYFYGLGLTFTIIVLYLRGKHGTRTAANQNKIQ